MRVILEGSEHNRDSYIDNKDYSQPRLYVPSTYNVHLRRDNRRPVPWYDDDIDRRIREMSNIGRCSPWSTVDRTTYIREIREIPITRNGNRNDVVYTLTNNDGDKQSRRQSVVYVDTNQDNNDNIISVTNINNNNNNNHNNSNHDIHTDSSPCGQQVSRITTVTISTEPTTVTNLLERINRIRKAVGLKDLCRLESLEAKAQNIAKNTIRTGVLPIVDPQTRALIMIRAPITSESLTDFLDLEKRTITDDDYTAAGVASSYSPDQSRQIVVVLLE